jgi:hypothetical protein
MRSKPPNQQRLPKPPLTPRPRSRSNCAAPLRIFRAQRCAPSTILHGVLSPAETRLLDALNQKGFDRASATVTAVMASRGITRPKDELVDILRQEPGLENREATQNAVDNLLGREWLRSEVSYKLLVVREAPDLKAKITALLGSAEAVEALSSASVSAAPWLTILGPMTDEHVYQTFLDSIKTAQKEIRLPMLATTPSLTAAPLLKERAKVGVKIRILLGSEDVVAKCRGDANRSTARDAIKGWTEHCRADRNMELRLFTRERDAMIASCMSVDGKTTRWDIYDVKKQRSLQGVMLEVQTPVGLEINLARAFEERFDDAWAHGRPLGRLRIAWWHIRRRWEFVATGIAILLLWVTSGVPLAATFLIGIASALGAAGIIREAERHGRLSGWRDV